jgi:hypothetical protein
MIPMSNKYRIILAYYKNLGRLEEIANTIDIPLYKLNHFAAGKNILSRNDLDSLRANIHKIDKENIPGLEDSNEIF